MDNVDILALPNEVNSDNRINNVLGDDIGYITLLDVMPRYAQVLETNRKTLDIYKRYGCDYAIVEAARISIKKKELVIPKSVQRDDVDLIRYLMRHRHTTPYEMVEFKFVSKMPIFVARQWIRHRM